MSDERDEIIQKLTDSIVRLRALTMYQSSQIQILGQNLVALLKALRVPAKGGGSHPIAMNLAVQENLNARLWLALSTLAYLDYCRAP